MPKCVYCGKEYDQHKGVTLVGKDGRIKKQWIGFVEENFTEMDKLISQELAK